jgi:hypothetical protein
VIRSIVRHNVKGGQFVGAVAEALDYRLPGCTLQRSKREDGSVIVLEKELEQPAAEPANAVVEHEVSTFDPDGP